MQTSPARSTCWDEGSPRGRRCVLVFSLVLGGAFVFTLLMLSLVVPAFAATGDTLTSGASLSGGGATASVDSPVAKVDASVSGGATASVDSPVAKVDTSVSGGGATASVDSPVAKVDASVSGGGATASVDSPVAKVDASVRVVGDSSGIPAIHLSLGDTSSRAPLGPAGGSPSEAPQGAGDGTSVASVPPLSGPAEPLLGTFDEPGIPPGTQPRPGLPPNPTGPYDPETATGLVPAPISSGGPDLSAISAAAVLLFLFGLLWFLLTSRSPVPPGNGRILLLPG